MGCTGEQLNAEDLAWMDKMALEEENPDELPCLDGYEVGEKDFVEDTKNAAGNITKSVFQHRAFADWLVDNSGEYFITLEDTDEIYVYIGGVYVPRGIVRIQQIFHEIMKGNHSNMRNMNEVVKHVRAATYKDKSIFDADEDIINVKNGLYKISTEEFLPHDPEYRVIAQNEVVYDPDAKCPMIDKFFEEVAEPDRLATMYEIAGYALMPKKNEKVGFILIGQPDTGKTQFNQVIAKLVGANMTATVSPNELAKDSHSGSDLFGKSLNVIDDLGTSPLNETSIIKALIGSGFIRVNPKNLAAFSFKPEILNIWCCNALPKTNDISFGDKFDLMYFDNVYGGHDAPDKHLINKLTTQSEMSGLFNKAIKAYRKVVENDRFTGAKSSKEKAQLYEFESRPIAAFCATKCRLVDDGVVLKDGFQKAYTQFCHSHRMRPESNQSVKKYLADEFAVFEKRDRLDGSYENARWCYLGIEILSESAIVSGFEDDKKNLTHKKPLSDDGFVPVVPTILPIKESMKKNKSIRRGSIGKKVGTDDNNADTDSENTENKLGTMCQKLGTDAKSGKHLKNGTPLDPDIESKLKHAVGKAIAKSETIGADISTIVECYPGSITTTQLRDMLEERGECLGFKERYDKWYVR